MSRKSFSIEPIAALSLDERGLMPLADARSTVAGAMEFTRGEADRLWLALLSLDDASEFVREASRLTWTFPFLRGWDNEDAVIRYGAGVLPWIDAMLERAPEIGSIPALPFYFVGSTLLALGPEAVRTVLRVRFLDDEDSDGIGFQRRWLKRHGAAARSAVVAEAERGNPDAARVVAADA